MLNLKAPSIDGCTVECLKNEGVAMIELLVRLEEYKRTGVVYVK